MVVNEELDASGAFVAAWLPVSEGAAIADLLFADAAGEPAYRFTGKLAFSWPRSEAQVRLNRDDDLYFPPVSFRIRAELLIRYPPPIPRGCGEAHSKLTP